MPCADFASKRRTTLRLSAAEATRMRLMPAPGRSHDRLQVVLRRPAQFSFDLLAGSPAGSRLPRARRALADLELHTRDALHRVDHLLGRVTGTHPHVVGVACM